MYDVAIVGSGITGSACAYFLSKYRLKIAVIEKNNDVCCGTTKANSAIIHAGYDPAAADDDPNRIIPLDALRQYEREGKFAHLHNYFYSTVGTGTTESEAARMAEEMVPYLQEAGVDGVIFTST